MSLWCATDPAPWAAALAAYPGVVAARGGERLTALDRWLHADLPAAVRARATPHLSHAELLELIRWKMHRGVWRAPNLKLAADNAPPAVEACSAEAFAAVPDPLRPVRVLARLKGVGAATASAALAAVYPAHYPFLDDVVAAQIDGLGEPAFTVRYYGAYAEALRARAAALAAADPAGAWTPHAVDLALWASAAE